MTSYILYLGMSHNNNVGATCGILKKDDKETKLFYSISDSPYDCLKKVFNTFDVVDMSDAELLVYAPTAKLYLITRASEELEHVTVKCSEDNPFTQAKIELCTAMAVHELTRVQALDVIDYNLCLYGF